MGFLHWAVWDRLDVLDRRVGFKSATSARADSRHILFWFPGLALLATFSFVRGHVILGLLELGFVLVGVGVLVFLRVRSGRW